MKLLEGKLTLDESKVELEKLNEGNICVRCETEDATHTDPETNEPLCVDCYTSRCKELNVKPVWQVRVYWAIDGQLTGSVRAVCPIHSYTGEYDSDEILDAFDREYPQYKYNCYVPFPEKYSKRDYSFDNKVERAFGSPFDESKQRKSRRQVKEVTRDGYEKTLDEKMCNHKLNEEIDFDKHIWEGWTVGDFIEELEPEFEMIMSGGSYVKPFKSKEELKKWTADNQPYYKKPIQDVVNYFDERIKKEFGGYGLGESKKKFKPKTQYDSDVGEKIEDLLSEYGIGFGDVVDNGDGTINLVGIFPEEWDETREYIEDEFGYTVELPCDPEDDDCIEYNEDGGIMNELVVYTYDPNEDQVISKAKELAKTLKGKELLNAIKELSDDITDDDAKVIYVDITLGESLKEAKDEDKKDDKKSDKKDDKKSSKKDSKKDAEKEDKKEKEDEEDIDIEDEVDVEVEDNKDLPDVDVDDMLSLDDIDIDVDAPVIDKPVEDSEIPQDIVSGAKLGELQSAVRDEFGSIDHLKSLIATITLDDENAQEGDEDLIDIINGAIDLKYELIGMLNKGIELLDGETVELMDKGEERAEDILDDDTLSDEEDVDINIDGIEDVDIEDDVFGGGQDLEITDKFDVDRAEDIDVESSDAKSLFDIDDEGVATDELEDDIVIKDKKPNKK